MERSNDIMSSHTELYTFLGRAIFWLRWSTLAVVLLLTLVVPIRTSVGIPTWVLVGFFAIHNVIIDVVRKRYPQRRVFIFLAIYDLLLAGVLYLLAAEPGGPLFVILILAVDSAAAILTLRATLFYTAVVAILTTTIDITIGLPTPSASEIRLLGTRLIVLVLLGAAMTILTRRLAMEQAEAQAAHEQASRLEALHHVRVDFVATLSHELRTPLTAARAALVLLSTSVGNRHKPDEQSLLDNARRNIERLSVLINDLLTHNQLEAGTLQLERKPYDLRTVIRDAITTVSPLMQEKRQHLEVDMPESLPLAGDPYRMEQVVINLLSNAHSHTPAGTAIGVTTQTTNSEVLLAVHDNGLGIPAAELERIFQRFYQLGVSNGGSGLGLAIAQRIVQLHGGRMWAESQPNDGTTFWVALSRNDTEE